MYPILEINVPHTGDPEILRLNWPHLQGWEELTRPATSHQGPDRGLNLEVPFSINLTLKTQLKIQKNVHSNHQPGFICKNTEDDHVDFDWPNPTCAGALQRKQEMDVNRQAHLGPQSRRRRGQAGARTRTSAWRWVSSTSASPKPAPPGPGGRSPAHSLCPGGAAHPPACLGVRGAGFRLPDPTRVGVSPARRSCSAAHGRQGKQESAQETQSRKLPRRRAQEAGKAHRLDALTVDSFL